MFLFLCRAVDVWPVPELFISMVPVPQVFDMISNGELDGERKPSHNNIRRHILTSILHCTIKSVLACRQRFETPHMAD